ncbi:hypothetical protein OROMI_014351 [Orobanche minor]
MFSGASTSYFVLALILERPLGSPVTNLKQSHRLHQKMGGMEVLNIELGQIIDACKFLDEKWNPKFLVIIAQDYHHTKFLQTIDEAVGGKFFLMLVQFCYEVLMKTVVRDFGSDHHFHPMSALEILRETVRILRYNSTGFMAIAALLICPVSVVVLSNVLVDQTLVKRLALRLMLVAKSSGLPLGPFIKHSCHKLSEVLVSVTMCFPLFITLSLLSKAAVVYSVDCTYSRKKFDYSKFYVIISKIWKRIDYTQL